MPGLFSYLFIKLNFGVKMLLCNVPEIFNLLCMISFKFCHGRVEDGFAASGDLFVDL